MAMMTKLETIVPVTMKMRVLCCTLIINFALTILVSELNKINDLQTEKEQNELIRCIDERSVSLRAT